jgi:hypothetical protein
MVRMSGLAGRKALQGRCVSVNPFFKTEVRFCRFFAHGMMPLIFYEKRFLFFVKNKGNRPLTEGTRRFRRVGLVFLFGVGHFFSRFLIVLFTSCLRHANPLILKRKNRFLRSYPVKSRSYPAHFAWNTRSYPVFFD